MWTKVSTALWTGAAMNVGLSSWSWGQMVFFLERACLQYFSATPHSCCWGCVLDEWEYVLSLYSFPGHLPSKESGLCLGHSMERILGLLCSGWGGGVHAADQVGVERTLPLAQVHTSKKKVVTQTKLLISCSKTSSQIILPGGRKTP